MDKKELYLIARGYEAPRAESVAIANEGYLLEASPILGEAEGEGVELFGREEGVWDQP